MIIFSSSVHHLTNAAQENARDQHAFPLTQLEHTTIIKMLL